MKSRSAAALRTVFPPLLVALLVSLAAGCSGKSPVVNTAPVNNAATVVNSTPGDNSARGSTGIVIVINGEGVTGGELTAFAREMIPGFRETDSAEWSAAADTLINNRLLAPKALKEKGLITDRVRSRIAIATNQLWEDPYWNSVVRDTVKVTEDDFLKSAPRFEDLLTVRQMVVSDRTEAAVLREQAAKSPGRFEELVKAKSEGLTASRGGVTSSINRFSQMYSREILDQLFATGKGEFTPVMESPIGYTFFHVMEKITPEEGERAWRKEVLPNLLKAKGKKVWDDHIRSLERKHKVEIHKETVEGYIQSMEDKQDVSGYLDKPAFSIDDTAYYLRELVDPSAQGVLHGTQTLEIAVDKRVRQHVLAAETERIGLKNRFPGILRVERFRTEGVLARAYLESRSRVVREPAPAAMKKYYDENKGKYVLPRALDISAIETRSTDRLKEIYKELAAGADFGDVAAKWTDNKRQPRGRVGLIPEGKISPEFRRVANIEIGAYTPEPVVLLAGEKDVSLYVVLRLNGVREKETIPYEKLNKADFAKAIIAIEKEKVVKSVIEELRRENKVEITPEYYSYVRSAIGRKSAGGEHAEQK